MTRLKYLDPADGQYKLLPVGGSGGSGSYVLKAGDTMTGPLVLPGNPASALQATPKQYVDSLGVLRFADASARNAAIPSPVQGMLTWLDDVKWYESHTAAGGWLPVAGELPYQRLVTNTATHNLPAATYTTFTDWPASTYPAFWSITNGVATIGKPGLYGIRATISADSPAGGTEFIAAIKISSTSETYNWRDYFSGGGRVRGGTYWEFRLAVGDTVQARYYSVLAQQATVTGLWDFSYLHP